MARLAPLLVLLFAIAAAAEPAGPIAGIAAGGQHSLTVTADGKVWAWGRGFDGQLGDGMGDDRNAPVRAMDLSGATAASAGDGHSLAIAEGGTVWAWGRNQAGQLGDGTFDSRSRPVRVLRLTGIRHLAAGSEHSLAVAADGQVAAWGQNENGQLADAARERSAEPILVAGMTDAIAVAAGAGHSLVLKSDGTVWSWGSNSQGQLGDGGYQSRPEPGPVTGLTRVVAISAFGNLSLAQTGDGRLWMWGELGSPAPVCIEGLPELAAISAGQPSLALSRDGTVWELETDPEAQQPTVRKSQVAGLSQVRAIAAGAEHRIALGSDGKLWTWGANDLGQLGLGDNRAQQAQPIAVWGGAGPRKPGPRFRQPQPGWFVEPGKAHLSKQARQRLLPLKQRTRVEWVCMPTVIPSGFSGPLVEDVSANPEDPFNRYSYMLAYKKGTSWIRISGWMGGSGGPEAMKPVKIETMVLGTVELERDPAQPDLLATALVRLGNAGRWRDPDGITRTGHQDLEFSCSGVSLDVAKTVLKSLRLVRL
ncbi:MAG: hypothetical protein HY319_21590 [Armatimonadetes bacterium]|nr:hypothetical protein [Armatimonadota bacterium]